MIQNASSGVISRRSIINSLAVKEPTAIYSDRVFTVPLLLSSSSREELYCWHTGGGGAGISPRCKTLSGQRVVCCIWNIFTGCVHKLRAGSFIIFFAYVLQSPPLWNDIQGRLDAHPF